MESDSENTISLEQKLLEFIARTEYRPMKPRLIAKKLRLPEDRIPELRKLVKKLVKRGLVVYGPKHLVEPTGQRQATGQPQSTGNVGQEKRGKSAPAVKGNRVVGVFRRARGGFGFVRPTAAGAPASRQTDIYVAARDAGDASTGDLVLVRLLKGQGRFGAPNGQIVEVVERETHRFVGTYFETAGLGMVQVDGTLFTQPIQVGDPGAKNAQPNDKVVFEMVRFPSHVHDGEGVLVEVLGPRGAPGVDTLSIMREYGLPEEFAEDALDAAREEADRFDESIPKTRSDFTGETVITIDPVDARDFDDAISLVRTEKGHWLLGVHIADVSHFVRPGTPLDREAYQRATSVYLPDRVIPMLPEVISNGLASLQPGRVRYTKTALIEFTPEGVRVGVDLHTGAIRSARRFTYEEVDEYLADREAWREKLDAKVHDLLARMHELAMTLRQRRFERGSLELSLSEVKVDLDKHGRVTGAHRVEQTESHQIIEEFMLAANEAVADTLAEAEIHFLRRVHASPDPRKLLALTEFVAELGFKTDSLESRFEIQRLLDLVRERPEQQAVNYSVLRSMQQAVYSPEAEGHYALASDCYCHFTSPIRRYPDLTIHRLVNALAAKKKPAHDYAELVVQGEHCSDRERRAESAERDLTKVKLLNYLSERIGEEMDAVITGVEEFGLFAQGLELPAEGFIHINALADDYYHFERRSHSLSGRRSGNTFRLGDVIRVTVAHVDIDRRQLDFRVVKRLGHPDRVPKPLHGAAPASARSGPERKKSRQAALRQLGGVKKKKKGQQRPGRAKPKKRRK